MKKRINDVFYSLQGEGRNAGMAAAFIRFAGCNLRCRFCDTAFSAYTEMDDGDLLKAILPWPTRFVVLTGGEPTLQLDDGLIGSLHSHGYRIAIETNGMRPIPTGIDWTTVSPKSPFVGEAARPVVERCDELKCLFDGVTPIDDCGIKADHYYLQPCDTGDAERNRAIAAACIDYIKAHPRWRLSLQTHKLIGFK